MRDPPLTPVEKLRDAIAALEAARSGFRHPSTRSPRCSFDTSGLIVGSPLDSPVQASSRFGSRFGMVEIILSEHQLARLKAAVPNGSIERAALEAGDYFAGDEIAPEPVAVTLTCTMALAKLLLNIAETSCPDVATGIRAAIDQQMH